MTLRFGLNHGENGVTADGKRATAGGWLGRVQSSG